ncbi:uncharacterized protein LOC135622989 isoform X2 [Musa acuminata AAA Group]|uniref:uncharacterized protein LOC135622989 isoform X2 n=1 Tax=Musa acuminata AAA Group TaxID=214697 RepID=UPI0031D6B38F
MSRDTVAAWVGSLPPLEPSPTKERKRNPSAEERGGHGIHGEERLDEAQGERRRQCWMDSLATKSRKTTKLNRFVHRFWLKVETKKTIPRGSLQSEDFKTKKIFVGGIRSTLTEGIRLMLLHCCRWRSRQLNQRKSQTSRLHMVVNLGHGRLVIALVVLATLIVVLEVADMALVPIGFLEVLVVGLVAMVLVLVNSVEDMVVLIED